MFPLTSKSRPENNATLRKAAILVAALDEATAESLLAGMPAAAARRVREVAGSLGPVSEIERRRVLTELMAARDTRRPDRRATYSFPAEDEGVELDATLAQRIAQGYEDDRAEETIPTPVQPPAGDGRTRPAFSRLRGSQPQTLGRILSAESPQTIAVVLAHLDRRQAAATLANLDEALQVEVVRRLGRLDEANAEVIREIETQLESVITEEEAQERKRSAGAEMVREILVESGGEDRHRLLTKLKSTDEQLAGRLRFDVDTSAPRKQGEPNLLHKPADQHYDPAPQAEGFRLPRFDDLALLADGNLAELLQTADAETALLAIAGAGKRFMRRLGRLLSARERRQLDRRLASLGPVRLADIEEAQRRMVQLAATLAKSEDDFAPDASPSADSSPLRAAYAA